MSEISDRLRRFILEEVLQSDLDITEDTPLIDSGILTSLQTVQLIGFIQSEFDVEVEPEDISESLFESLATLSRYVAERRPARS